MPSVEPRLYAYFSAGRGSDPRPRRPEPAFAYPFPCPVSRDTSNTTMPAQPSPRACTHVTSAPRWTYFHGKARLQHASADTGGCGSAFTPIFDGTERGRPLLRIAATAVDHLPRLVAAGPHMLPSAHGLRISVRCATADPEAGTRQCRALPGRCAPHTSPGQWAPWRAIHSPTPGRRNSSPEPPRLAPHARCGTGTPPKRMDSGGAAPHPDQKRPPRRCSAAQATFKGPPRRVRCRAGEVDR